MHGVFCFGTLPCNCISRWTFQNLIILCFNMNFWELVFWEIQFTMCTSLQKQYQSLSALVLFDCRCMLIIDLCLCPSLLTSSVPLILFPVKRLMMTTDSLFQACAGGRTQTCSLLPIPVGVLKFFRWSEVKKKIVSLTGWRIAVLDAFFAAWETKNVSSDGRSETEPLSLHQQGTPKHQQGTPKLLTDLSY